MKMVCLALAALVASCAFVGCGGPNVPNSVCLQRQQQYQRLAIVCAPKPGADPQYADVILKSVQGNVMSRLGFLKKADVLSDVTVDTSSTPPKVRLNNAADYDAVLCLVYSYGAGHVYLDLRMLDAKTGQEIWYHQLDKLDPNIKTRLSTHGYWVPSTVKMKFYGAR